MTAISESGEELAMMVSDFDFSNAWVTLTIFNLDPNSHCIGESANCAIVVQFKDNKTSRLIAAADNNIVQGFFFPGVEREGVLMRFKAAVTTLSCNDEVSGVEPVDEFISMLIFISFSGLPLDLTISRLKFRSAKRLTNPSS